MRKRPARLVDVANEAGVSRGLVSRILNGDPTLTVPDSTRENVLSAVSKLKYSPNSSAQALRKSRTNVFGLVLEHVTNPVFAEMVQGAQHEASALNSFLMLVDADNLGQDGSYFMRAIRGNRIDGLLLQAGYGASDDYAFEIADTITTVIVNNRGLGRIPGICLDDRQATQLATQHLIELGHKAIAFISGTPGMASANRIDGFKAAVTSSAPDGVVGTVFDAGWEAQDGFEAVERIMSRAERPTAIVVASAVTSVGALAAISRAGLRVPDDLSIITIHDPWFLDFLVPSLTTVRMPMYDLGRSSVKLLDSVLRDDSTVLEPTTYISDPPPKLITRQSTAHAAQ